MTARPRSTDASRFRYCPFCRAILESREKEGAIRPVCPGCSYVQYRNPVVGVAAVIREEAVVRLLGKEAVARAVEPASGEPAGGAARYLLGRRRASYRGSYCFPCGYVEFDEDLHEALIREVEEETGLLVEPRALLAAHSNFHDPDHQSVGIWFACEPVGGRLRAGDDIDRLRFALAPDPGVPLAFPTDRLVLEQLAGGGNAPPGSV